ncbi:hypothetical protein L210DRAFT_146022 [Boletus edulis BED1]|uniref:Uncharacterized protein n=1 Tax=Boletus edulis BED1 TaxID=1328754 RepID=A0AAD4C8K6_BOLED|nr:hypothetical protein L210DRAFT_146022 [Boletus edulis BED1]
MTRSETDILHELPSCPQVVHKEVGDISPTKIFRKPIHDSLQQYIRLESLWPHQRVMLKSWRLFAIRKQCHVSTMRCERVALSTPVPIIHCSVDQRYGGCFQILEFKSTMNEYEQHVVVMPGRVVDEDRSSHSIRRSYHPQASRSPS